jgi:hypothetical protein
MKRGIGVLATVIGLTACGGLPPMALPPSPTVNETPFPATSAAAGGQISPSPSASPSSQPPAAGGAPAYGVLVDLLGNPGYYTVSLVQADGTVSGSERFGQRTPIVTASGHAIVLPYVSTTLTALYALGAGSTVVEAPPGQRPTAVMRLPVGAGQEAAFALSPDGRLIAYTVLDFTRSPVHVTLYTDTMGGGDRKAIFASDSDYVWPVAWHSGLLVLAHAYGPYEEDVTKAAPGRDNPYSAISYHVVDPANANRVVLMGGCTVSGPLSPAGSACIQGGSIDWQGHVTQWGSNNWGSISSASSLSPAGDHIAAAMPNYPYNVGLWQPSGTVLAYDIIGPGPRDWAGWLDNDHLLVASGAYRLGYQMRVITVPAPGQSTPTSMGTADGFYAARLPTDIV